MIVVTKVTVVAKVQLPVYLFIEDYNTSYTIAM